MPLFFENVYLRILPKILAVIGVSPFEQYIHVFSSSPNPTIQVDVAVTEARSTLALIVSTFEPIASHIFLLAYFASTVGTGRKVTKSEIKSIIKMWWRVMRKTAKKVAVCVF